MTLLAEGEEERRQQVGPARWSFVSGISFLSTITEKPHWCYVYDGKRAPLATVELGLRQIIC